MNTLNFKLTFLSLFCLMITSAKCFSQSGNVTINQDKHIAVLLDIKKELNKNVADPERYKIQLYSGNRSGAQNAKAKFSNSFSDSQPSMQYETPNFKVWVGNYRTRLEADRALKRIKRKFPSAFIFKPKKN
ncbi:SPOR domain-containing protein [uncultured Algibacter sp.]|uniref:SPOR domain-containing protein n=1 Tax=uncultured Algibacter sp. TaxID=298659 RepID=UPI0032170F7D